MANIASLIFGFAATVFVGKQWLTPLVGGVKGLYSWQTRRLLSQAHKAEARKKKIVAKMAGAPRWWDFILSEHQLASMRSLAKQQNHWNKGQRQKWGLEPLSLVDNDGFYSMERVEINGREFLDLIQGWKDSNEVRDTSGLVFYLLVVALMLGIFGELPL